MTILKEKWTVKKYDIQDELYWDSFIDEKGINSTFLHTRRFLNHNILNLQEDFSFMFYKKGNLSACIPAVLIVSDGRSIWNSHLRSTYGGLIINKEVGIEDVLLITNMLDQELKKYNIDEAIIRNTFRVFNKMYCDEFDYSLWKFGFKLKSREIEIGISILGKTYSDIYKTYDNGNKYNIKKALKNVEVRFSDDFLAFWQILNKNLLENHDKKPVHDFETFSCLLKYLKENEIRLIAAFVDNKMVSGMILFNFNNLFLHAQYIASDFNFQHLRPVNAIIDFGIHWACENRFNYFNLGTPNENQGKIINLGLSYFKESFGGRSCLRETMHKHYNNDHE